MLRKIMIIFIIISSCQLAFASETYNQTMSTTGEIYGEYDDGGLPNWYLFNSQNPEEPPLQTILEDEEPPLQTIYEDEETNDTITAQTTPTPESTPFNFNAIYGILIITILAGIYTLYKKYH